MGGIEYNREFHIWPKGREASKLEQMNDRKMQNDIHGQINKWRNKIASPGANSLAHNMLSYPLMQFEMCTALNM